MLVLLRQLKVGVAGSELQKNNNMQYHITNRKSAIQVQESTSRASINTVAALIFTIPASSVFNFQ